MRQLSTVLEWVAPTLASVADLLMLAEEPAEPKARGAAAPDDRAGLLAALEAHGFNMMRTARSLGIALNTLKSRMANHGIQRRSR